MMSSLRPVVEVGVGAMPAAISSTPSALLSRIDRVWIIVIVVAIVCLLRSRRSLLPPSPPGLPILGHLHLFPKASERYKTFTSWSKQYGPIISLKMGSQDFLLFGGDGTVLSELVDKRGAVYSGRPDRLLDRSLDRGESIL